MSTKISHPPTNSLSTYSCGIVGQFEYSLMPILFPSQQRSSTRPHQALSTKLHPSLQDVHTLSQLLILQHIKCRKLRRVYALQS